MKKSIMKKSVIKHRLSILPALCLLAFLMVTSCGKEDIAPVRTVQEVTSELPSFEPTALLLADLLRIAGQHNWAGQSELLTDLINPDRTFTEEKLEAAEAALGIPYAEFQRLTTELGSAAFDYIRALTALNLSPEAQSDAIRDAIASSAALEGFRNPVAADQERCLLQDLCYVIGGFFVEVYLNLFCDFFCEEEAVALYVTLREFCLGFPC